MDPAGTGRDNAKAEIGACGIIAGAYIGLVIKAEIRQPVIAGLRRLGTADPG